ncbi:sigma-54-dependent transcriptional regulator HbcR [soil metagenome]
MITEITPNEVKAIRDKALYSLHELFDQLAEGAFVVDQHSRITWANTRYLDFLGITDANARVAVIGKHIAEVVPTTLMPQVVKTGISIPFDIIDVNGKFVAVSRFPIKDEAGDVIGGFCFVLFDNLQPLRPVIARISQLQEELETTKVKLERVRRSKYNFSQFVGTSSGATDVKQQAKRAASSDSTVLLLGESGTGKELIAQAIHAASLRAGGNFVGINVAAVPEDLLEAEFFGAAPGAYTGAGPKGRVGKMALANGGTLFLDEIADMPLQVQVKLLRALQEREVEAIGSNTVTRLDIRIIAATSRDLSAMVKQGKFRADLFYRLNVLPIYIPPLRERSADIPLLVDALLEDVCKMLGIALKEMDASAISFLQMQSWPGNIRELRNTIERVCVLNSAAILTESDFRSFFGVSSIQAETESIDRSNFHQSVQAMEKEMVLEAIIKANGNKTLAAKLLGISRSNLYIKLESFELNQSQKWTD